MARTLTMTRTITMTHDYQLNQRASETTRLGVRNVKRAKSFEFLRLLPTSRLFKTMGNNHKSGSPLGAQKFKSKMGNNHLQTTLASMGNNHNVYIYIYFFFTFLGQEKDRRQNSKRGIRNHSHFGRRDNSVTTYHKNPFYNFYHFIPYSDYKWRYENMKSRGKENHVDPIVKK